MSAVVGDLQVDQLRFMAATYADEIGQKCFPPLGLPARKIDVTS